MYIEHSYISTVNFTLERVTIVHYTTLISVNKILVYVACYFKSNTEELNVKK